MPLGPYKNWNECLADQIKKGKSKKVAAKVCGKIEQLSKKGKSVDISTEKINKILTQIWIEDVLNHDQS